MHCCNINKSRRGDFFWFTWYETIVFWYFSDRVANGNGLRYCGCVITFRRNVNHTSGLWITYRKRTMNGKQPTRLYCFLQRTELAVVGESINPSRFTDPTFANQQHVDSSSVIYTTLRHVRSQGQISLKQSCVQYTHSGNCNFNLQHINKNALS